MPDAQVLRRHKTNFLLNIRHGYSLSTVDRLEVNSTHLPLSTCNGPTVYVGLHLRLLSHGISGVCFYGRRHTSATIAKILGDASVLENKLKGISCNYSCPPPQLECRRLIGVRLKVCEHCNSREQRCRTRCSKPRLLDELHVMADNVIPSLQERDGNR